jgi:hypothetical protein
MSSLDRHLEQMYAKIARGGSLVGGARKRPPRGISHCISGSSRVGPKGKTRCGRYAIGPSSRAASYISRHPSGASLVGGARRRPRMMGGCAACMGGGCASCMRGGYGTKAGAMKNEWLRHVEKFISRNPVESYKQALQMAARSYDKSAPPGRRSQL